MGSGFYEGSDDNNKIPSVLKNVVDTLQKAELLTRRPQIDIFVNPKGCQAVAESIPAFNDAGWKVREAGRLECFKGFRSLHAKFIFSANLREDSNLCNSAWLYMGSGNLTGPGFVNQMGSQSGNLEAGVVITPESLRWSPAKGIPPECIVTNLLPLQWDTDFSENQESLATGTEMPEPEVQYSAAPVAYFFWIVVDEIGRLQTREEIEESFDLLDPAGSVCQRDPFKGFPWPGTRPRQVQVRWCAAGQERQAWVPVIDEFGRIAATILPRIGIEEVWSQLANFPMPPDDEELLADGDAEPADDRVQSSSGISFPANYPVRQMMQLKARTMLDTGNGQ
jgi:hypothetical protein